MNWIEAALRDMEIDEDEPTVIGVGSADGAWSHNYAVLRPAEGYYLMWEKFGDGWRTPRTLEYRGSFDLAAAVKHIDTTK